MSSATQGAANASTTPAALGEAVYAAECAACHGDRGQGQPNWQVANADGSLPAPPHDASGHTWHHPDDELLQIIARGGSIYLETSTMPAYENTLTEQEMVAVLDYIKTMWGPREQAYQAEQTWMRRSLTATQASPGDS